MSLALGQALAPQYNSAPSWVKLSAVPISPRFPRDGATAAGPASGVTGLAGTITPARSVIEAQSWGATCAVWSYTNLAASYGYASPAAFVNEFRAAGIPIQGTANASPVDATNGPFMQDLAGVNFKAATASTRPALNSGSQSPLAARGTTTISFMPANDSRTAALTRIETQVAAGIDGLQYDDPRSPAAYAGFRAHIPSADLTSQAADFSPTAIAGFPAWLAANTTSAQRTAVGLPSDPTGFNIKDWLIANKSPVLYGANQVNPTAIDAYLYRVAVPNDSALRTIIHVWYVAYLRADTAAWLRQAKAAAGVPFSLNLFSSSPQDHQTWVVRGANRDIFDFAISEVFPPYWQQLSAYTVGSDAFINARWAQCGQQHMQMAMNDAIGLRTLVEHKPTSLTQAPPRVVKQLLRQSIMQTVMEGHVPVVPIDVFMSTGEASTLDQGVDVDGYRFWGGVADYGDCFAFIKANAALLDGYEKMAIVHVVCHNDSYPFYATGRVNTSSVTLYDRLGARFGELFAADVDFHMLTCGDPQGTLFEVPDAARVAAAPLVICMQDTSDMSSMAGVTGASKFRRWSSNALREAANYSPARSLSPYVVAATRYNATTRRVSVHLHNYAVNSDGTPKPMTTQVRWNPMFGTPGMASVVRLGEAPGTVDLSRGFGQVTLREYAIVNFAVA